MNDAEQAGDQGSCEGEECGLAQVRSTGSGDEKWKDLLDRNRVTILKPKALDNFR